MDNIAEVFTGEGTREFCQFLSISSGSIGEVRSQSYRTFDNRYISEETLNELQELTDSLSRKIFNLMNYLKKSDFKGLKYSL